MVHPFTFYKYAIILNKSKPAFSCFFISCPSPKAMASRSVTRRCTHLTSAYHSSAARTFLQLAPSQRHMHSTPLLDFLAPNIPVTHGLRSRESKACYPGAQRPTHRGFTSTIVRRQTSAIVNPRQDDDGVDMTLEITPRASNVRKPTP